MFNYFTIIVVFFSLFFTFLLFGQSELSYSKSGHFTFDSKQHDAGSHLSGTLFRAKNTMGGNKIRTTFYNYGLIGRWGDEPDDIGGEWPINSNHEYIGDVGIMVGAEIIDNNGVIKNSVVTTYSPRGSEINPGTDAHWGWEPLEGYANPDSNLAAISTDPSSWPQDWNELWLGEYDLDELTSSQEAFFIMDDNADREFDYYPCPSDSNRRGLGLVITSHYKQWDHWLLDDVMFMEYNLLNECEKDLDKVVFGAVVGTIIGGDGDSGDDWADFDLENDIAYSYDNGTDLESGLGGIGAGGWTPVGLAGFTILESPSNSIDGIDNDGDGASGSGNIIAEDMFQPVAYAPGDQVVVIDYDNYNRTIVTMPDDSLAISYNGETLVFYPGTPYEEIERNLIDDNLDGLIDENNGYTIETSPGFFEDIYLNIGLKYVDFITDTGIDNFLIDEERDEIGLTSFFYFTFGTFSDMGWDEGLWEKMYPGYFNDAVQNVDADILFGSGYFPLPAGETEKITLAMVFGDNLNDLILNVANAKGFYNGDYIFSEPDFEVDFPDSAEVVTGSTLPIPISGDSTDWYILQTSTDNGDNWVYADTILSGAINYALDLTSVSSGVFNRIQIAAINDYGFEERISPPFSINNSPVPPQAYLTSPRSGNHLSGMITVNYLSGDANGDTFTLQLQFSGEGQMFEFITDLSPGMGSYLLDTEQLPNTTNGVLRIAAQGDDGLTNYDISGIVIDNPWDNFSDSLLSHFSGLGTGNIQVYVVDQSSVQDHTYRLTFTESDSSGLTYSVYDLDIQEELISAGTEVNGISATPEFDGLRLFIEDDETRIRSKGFSPMYEENYSAIVEPFNFAGFATEGYPQPIDFSLFFSDDLTGQSQSINLIKTNGDTFTIESNPANFVIRDPNNQSEIQFAFMDQTWLYTIPDSLFNPDDYDYYNIIGDPDIDPVTGDTSWNVAFVETGHFSYGDRIILLEELVDTIVVTWVVSPASHDSIRYLNKPGAGDTLKINTWKEFTEVDTFFIAPVVLSVNSDRLQLPNEFTLRQNFPNPFNPVTTIVYYLPKEVRVNLIIYDILGRQVRTLVNEIQKSGYISATWDGKNDSGELVSSGVYLYRLQAENLSTSSGQVFIQTKKMLLMK